MSTKDDNAMSAEFVMVPLGVTVAMLNDGREVLIDAGMSGREAERIAHAVYTAMLAAAPAAPAQEPVVIPDEIISVREDGTLVITPDATPRPKAFRYLVSYDDDEVFFNDRERACQLASDLRADGSKNVEVVALWRYPIAAAATPPAPRVVMPERMPMPSHEGVILNAEVRSWNACLDELARLNPGSGAGESDGKGGV